MKLYSLLCVSDGVVCVLTHLCYVVLMTQFVQSHKTLTMSDILLFTTGISDLKTYMKRNRQSDRTGLFLFLKNQVCVVLQASAYLSI